MLQSHTRKRVAEYLVQHGPLEDSKGKATAKLREAIGYDGSEASFTQLIANMSRAGQLIREVEGKRTYRIASITPDIPLMDVENDQDVLDDAEMDYDEVASSLLLQVVQLLTQKTRGKENDSSWARRRMERFGRRIDELERQLSQANAETRAVVVERNALRMQLEHSEANLALLSDRLSSGKVPERELSKLLRNEDKVLLNQLRGNVANKREGRAS